MFLGFSIPPYIALKELIACLNVAQLPKSRKIRVSVTPYYVIDVHPSEFQHLQINILLLLCTVVI